MALEDFLRRSISRRTALKASAASFLGSQMALFEGLVVAPQRPTFAATFSDIQFDIGQFLAPPVTLNDGGGTIVAGFGPVFNMFLPTRLLRNPTTTDQAKLVNALAAIEANFPTSPAGAFVHMHYGIPYFNRFNQTLVRSKIPRLLLDTNRLALEESPVFPTDFTGGAGTQNPTITKDRFAVPIRIERNEVLWQLKSDNLNNLVNIVNWLEGSNNLNGNFVPSPDFDLFLLDTIRVQFTQIGLPRKVADNAAQQNPTLYEFHTRINPDSPMWMGFLDQHVNAAAAPQAVTFVGSSKGVFTNARAGDYFDNGSICHFSHDIEDLFQFYATPNQDSRRPDGEPFTERVQYSFRSNQLGTADGLPTDGNSDQFTNGGGPAYIPNVFQGADSAQREAADAGGTFGPNNATKDATFQGAHRIGHIDGLQRSSRSTVDGSPLHIRNDGPGFSNQDVPAFQDFPGGTNFGAGTTQPKLQFLVFVPTAEFFRVMRVNVAAQDLQNQFLGGQDDDNGLERFITATRRQNFLTPPRRHRAFPLVELT